jgi:hypothetical protein
MSGSDPKENRSGAAIWLLGLVVVIVIGATMRDNPITIAAADDPPSISAPVTGFDPGRRSAHEQAMHEQGMHERVRKSDSLPPFGQPGTQIYYGGWNGPQ